MKIYAQVIAYNEEPIIERSLKSIYKYVNEIVVVEGSMWGPSKDKTKKIAKSIGNKVSIISGTFPPVGRMETMHIMRNLALSKIPKNHDDWCIHHDADEVFNEESIAKLTEMLKRRKFPSAFLISYPHVLLWGDETHTIEGTPMNRMREVGTFRLEPGVVWKNFHRVGIEGEAMSFCGMKKPRRIVRNDIFYYHHGYAVSEEKYKQKMLYYFLRVGGQESEWETYWENTEKKKWDSRMDSSKVKHLKV